MTEPTTDPRVTQVAHEIAMFECVKNKIPGEMILEIKKADTDEDFQPSLNSYGDIASIVVAAYENSGGKEPSLGRICATVAARELLPSATETRVQIVADSIMEDREALIQVKESVGEWILLGFEVLKRMEQK